MDLYNLFSHFVKTLLFLFITLVTTPVIAERSQYNIVGNVTGKAVLPSQNGLSEASSQYLIRYRSISGVDGKTPREDTAAVFLPKGETPQEGWPVVVWAHGTVGIATHCAPSLNARSPRDSQYLNTWLSLGFAVVAPDYAGLGSEGLHHYLHSRATAWSVLDSARAALSVFPLQNRIVLVGQSQGAHAAFASAGYHKKYAPQLNILATIVTGTPYFNATTSVQQVFGTSNITGPDPKIPYAFYIYLSAEDIRPYLKAENYFQPLALPFLQQAREMCITPLTEQVNRYSLNAANTLKPAIQTLLDTQIETMLYPTLHIEHPIFIGIGGDDINVPTAMQQRFAAAVSAAGTKTVVREYNGLDHSGTVNPSLRDSVPFLLEQLHDTGNINHQK